MRDWEWYYFKTATRAPERIIPVGEGHHLSLHPNGEHLLVSKGLSQTNDVYQKGVQEVDLMTGEVASLRPDSSLAAYSPDGTMVAAAEDKAVVLWPSDMPDQVERLGE